MKRFILLLALASFLNCKGGVNSPTPLDPVCYKACDNLRKIGCPDVWGPDWNNSITCERECHALLLTEGPKLHVACWLNSKTCSEVETCNAE